MIELENKSNYFNCAELKVVVAMMSVDSRGLTEAAEARACCSSASSCSARPRADTRRWRIDGESQSAIEIKPHNQPAIAGESIKPGVKR